MLWAWSQGDIGVTVSRRGAKGTSHLQGWSSARLLDASCLVMVCSLERLPRAGCNKHEDSVDEFSGHAVPTFSWNILRQV